MVENTRRILNLFDRHNAKGTFFFLGWAASRFPSLVREVQAGGHELACHSYWHRRVCSMTLREFREDVRISKDAIEQVSGVPIYGYRAPSWSIDKSCLWALDILGEQGFLYDSSIYPIRHDIYGFPDAPRFAYVYKCRNGRELTEIPPPTVRIAGFNLPGAGGGYFRILPFFYTKSVFHIFERHYIKPVVTYFHPWEIDSEQPRISANLKSRFRHYTNLGIVEKRLDLMLEKYLFQPIATALSAGGLLGSRADSKSVDTRYQRCPVAPGVSPPRQSEWSKG